MKMRADLAGVFIVFFFGGGIEVMDRVLAVPGRFSVTGGWAPGWWFVVGTLGAQEVLGGNA